MTFPQADPNLILPPGTLLQGGKYRVESLLGQGAFGQVYLVLVGDPVLGGVQRALKILRGDSPNLGVNNITSTWSISSRRPACRAS